MPVINLTELQVTEEIDHSGKGAIFRTLTDPYPDKTPLSILTREYLIKSQTLTAASTVTFYPFELLMADQTIKDYLKLFKFLRAGVKLRILFLTNPNQYGLIGVSSLPFQQDPAAFVSVSQQSQSDQHLLDITEQTGIEIDLPYLSPEIYFDLEQTRLTIPTYLPHYWRVAVYPYVIGTVTLGTPATVQMRVFASLTDLSTAGYIPNHAKVIQFQAADGAPGNIMHGMNMQRIVSGGLAVASTLGTVAYTRLSDQVGSKMESAVKSAVDVGVGKVEKLINATVSGDPIRETAEPEVAQASRRKPESGTKVKMDVVPDISTMAAHDGSSSNVLGDNISCQHTFLPSLRNVFDIKRICSIPTYVQTNTLSTVGDNFVIDCNPFMQGTHSEYIGKMFKYTRFDTKVHFQICCSALTRTRLRFTDRKSVV